MTLDEIIEKLTKVRNAKFPHEAVSIKSLTVEKNKNQEIAVDFIYYMQCDRTKKGRATIDGLEEG